MTTSQSAYCHELARVAASRSVPSIGDVSWQEAADLVEPQDLLDAFATAEGVRSLLSSLDVQFRPGPKDWERFVQKRHVPKRDKPRPPFKTFCDFAAIRLITPDPASMWGRRQTVQAAIAEAGGLILDRSRPQQFYGADRLPAGADLCDYLYFYTPELGHWVECQILHPFAAYVFSENSKRGSVRIVDFFAQRPGGSLYHRCCQRILANYRAGLELELEVQEAYRGAGKAGVEIDGRPARGRDVPHALREWLLALRCA